MCTFTQLSLAKGQSDSTVMDLLPFLWTDHARSTKAGTIMAQGWNLTATNWYWRWPELSRQWLGRKSAMAIATFSDWPWCICFSHLFCASAATDWLKVDHATARDWRAPIKPISNMAFPKPCISSLCLFMGCLVTTCEGDRKPSLIRTARTKLSIAGASRSCLRKACFAVSPATGVYFPKPQ